MKFLCPSCKAKYQIADEKILGRTLKMTCRRCNTAITVRGDLPGAGDAEAVAELDAGAAAKPAAASPAAASPAGPTPSARPHAQPGATAAALAAGGGSALGADFRKQGLAPAEAKTAAIEQWHVAINEVPVGPMRREEVSRKMATGAVTAESLAWREGFDDWRPVRDIPELAALLRKPEAAAPPRGLPAPRTGAAVRPAPVAARPAPRAGAATAAVGPAAKGTSATPSARSNVVPIGGRLGGAAPALEEDEQSADEPTQVASMRDLGLLAAEQAQAQKDGRGTAKAAAPAADARKPAAPPSADQGAGGPEAAMGAATAEASTSSGLAAAPSEGAPLGSPLTAAAGRAEAAKGALMQAAAEPAASPPASGGDDGLPPLLEAPGPAFVTPTAPPPAAPLSEPPAPSIPPRRTAERRGIPVGGWIAIAGSVAFGGVFAVIAAQRLLPPPPAAPAPVAAAATLAPPAAPTPPPAAPPVGEPSADPVADPVAPPTEAAATVADEAAAAPASERTGGRHRGGTTTVSGGAAAGTTTTGGARPLSPDFARLSEDSTSLPAISGGAASRRLGGEPSGSGARRELSADEIREVVSRERTGLTRCWETAIRGMRETPTVRLDVSVTIGTSGAVTNAAARGPTVGSLTECIERSVRRWHFPPSGGTTETSFPVVFSGSS